MIAIISDLHLQDHANTEIRNAAGKPLINTDKLAVSPDAFSMFFDEVLAAANQNLTAADPKEITLVLAGDIFEIHRSPLWLQKEDAPRPWDKEDLVWESIALAVMDGIEESNRGIFKKKSKKRVPDSPERNLFEHFAADCSSEGYTLKIIYITGNHDRLLMLSERLRTKAAALLGMTGSDLKSYCDGSNGEAQTGFCNCYFDSRYGLLVRHGHEYDKLNFGGTVALSGKIDRYNQEDYSKPTLGDYLTIDVAARLSYEFRKAYGDKILGEESFARQEDKMYTQVYVMLQEFDDVRPETGLMDFLTFRLGGKHDLGLQLIKNILDRIAEKAKKNPFFMVELQRTGKGEHWWEDISGSVRYGAFKYFGTGSLLIKQMGSPFNDDAYTYANREAVLAEPGNILYIVAGHTHHPGKYPLTVRADGKEQFFFDSGTWRKVYDKCQCPSPVWPNIRFAGTKSMTYLFFYKSNEDLDTVIPKTYSFDYWTGNTKKVE